MIPTNTSRTSVPQMKFAALYLCSLILIVTILSAFWGPLPATPVKERANVSPASSQEQELLKGVSLLHEQFRKLCVLQEQAKQNPLAGTEAIKTETGVLRRQMDSMQMKSSAYSSTNKKKLFDMLSTFNVAISRATEPASLPANGQDAIKWENTIREKDELIREMQAKLSNAEEIPADAGRQLQSLRNEIDAKNRTVAELEKQLKNNNTSKATTEELAKLRSDNKYLSLALTSQADQTRDLTEINKQLRAEADRLKKRN